MRVLFSLLCLLSVAACANPNAMPTGYTYYATEFNARPGPEMYRAASDAHSCGETCKKKCEMKETCTICEGHHDK